jgi:hypothetical protein
VCTIDSLLTPPIDLFTFAPGWLGGIRIGSHAKCILLLQTYNRTNICETRGKMGRTNSVRIGLDRRYRWLRDMIAGATAGGIGNYLTNPFDVIKTRLQTTDVAGAALYGGSISKCALPVLEEGGAAAFLRGSVPRLLHKVPAKGFFFVFYEFFKRALNSE